MIIEFPNEFNEARFVKIIKYKHKIKEINIKKENILPCTIS